MNKVSVTEKEYIREGIKLKVRNDGRANTDIRDIWLQMGTLKQANGSCTLYDPDSEAKIHIGIKLEIGVPTKEKPEEGIIKLGVDSYQRSTVNYMDKREITDVHEDIKYLLEEFMMRPLDKKGFCLVPGKICWIVNIDVFCLSVLKPVYIDRISMGIRAALVNLEIPELNISQNQITTEYEVEIIEDKIRKIEDFLDINKVPIVITIGEVDKALVVDLTDEEYQCLDCRYVLAVDIKGEIYGINKIGGGGILFEDMPKVFKLAKTATYELIKNENKFMQAKNE